MNQETFNQHTEDLRKAFPSWSKIRKDPNSNGAQLLNVIGLQFEELANYMQYAYEQYYIGTMDLNQVDIIYRTRIPNSLLPSDRYQLMAGSHFLTESKNDLNFLAPLKQATHNSQIQYRDEYFVDFDSKHLYVHLPYGISENYKYGHVILTIKDEFGDDAYKEVMPLEVHHVWNFFDELGLVLQTPRLFAEKNVYYKERLLDVFRRPSNSTHDGLVNGIGRELALVQEAHWMDGGSDIVLNHNRINTNTILVDNIPYPYGLIFKESDGRVRLGGHPDYAGIRRTVRYIAGVDLHALHDKSDTRFQQELFQIDGAATPLLKYYIDIIRDQVPMMWDQWKWNQGFWDTASTEMSGYGRIPSFHDADVSGWVGYNPKEE